MVNCCANANPDGFGPCGVTPRPKTSAVAATPKRTTRFRDPKCFTASPSSRWTSHGPPTQLINSDHYTQNVRLWNVQGYLTAGGADIGLYVCDPWFLSWLKGTHTQRTADPHTRPQNLYTTVRMGGRKRSGLRKAAESQNQRLCATRCSVGPRSFAGFETNLPRFSVKTASTGQKCPTLFRIFCPSPPCFHIHSRVDLHF